MARAGAVLRDEGPYALFDRALSQLGVHRLVVLEQRLDAAAAAAPAPASTLGDLSFAEASELDVEAIAALRAAEHDEVSLALGRPLEPVQARLARMFEHGERCFVARAGERVVAVLWVGRGQVSVRYLLCDLLLAADDAYVYDVFAAPELRGRGTVTALYRYAASALTSAGFARAVMLVRVHNSANLRAAVRAGYRRLGTLSCVAAGGRRLYFGDALPIRAWPPS